ncbi:MAG: hypothetical protein AAGH99_14470 [Planctomycetota bacterium]
MKFTELTSILREILPAVEDVANALDNERLEEWLEQSEGDHLSAERTINHVHILDVLSTLELDSHLDQDDLLFFAEIYVAVLRDRLANRFPDTRFVMETLGREQVAEDPLELIVTYHRDSRH